MSENQVDQALVVRRDSRGRLLPGSTANRLGRPPGGLNARTVLANRTLARAAEKAARVIIDALDSHVDWIRISAARVIIDRLDSLGSEEGDGLWTKHLTDREIRVVSAIIRRAQVRAARGEEPPDPWTPKSAPAPVPEPADELIIDLKPEEP